MVLCAPSENAAQSKHGRADEASETEVMAMACACAAQPAWPRRLPRERRLPALRVRQRACRSSTREAPPLRLGHGGTLHDADPGGYTASFRLDWTVPRPATPARIFAASVELRPFSAHSHDSSRPVYADIRPMIACQLLSATRRLRSAADRRGCSRSVLCSITYGFSRSFGGSYFHTAYPVPADLRVAGLGVRCALVPIICSPRDRNSP